jgi:hypothetical protein
MFFAEFFLDAPLGYIVEQDNSLMNGFVVNVLRIALGMQ